MSAEFRKRIIEEEIDDESVTEVLQSIRDFKLGLIRSITKTDTETIARYGFRFKTKTIAGRREEVRQFVLEHPALMAGDIGGLKKNFKILGTLLKERKTMCVTESESESEPEPKPKPKTKSMSKPKRTQQKESDSESEPEHKHTRSLKKNTSTMIQSLVVPNYSEYYDYEEEEEDKKEKTHTRRSLKAPKGKAKKSDSDDYF